MWGWLVAHVSLVGVTFYLMDLWLKVRTNNLTAKVDFVYNDNKERDSFIRQWTKVHEDNIGRLYEEHNKLEDDIAGLVRRMEMIEELYGTDSSRLGDDDDA